MKLEDVPCACPRICYRHGTMGSMTAKDGCAFCRIAHFDLEHQVLRRHSGAVVFEPLSPCTPGHLLVVPVRHVDSAATNAHVTALTMHAAALELQRLGQDANLVVNDGPVAGQTVHHLHVHVVPRRFGDGLGYRWRTEPPPHRCHTTPAPVMGHSFRCPTGEHENGWVHTMGGPHAGLCPAVEGQKCGPL